MTEMAGPPKLVEEEGIYFELLGKMSKVAIARGVLTLSDGIDQK